MLTILRSIALLAVAGLSAACASGLEAGFQRVAIPFEYEGLGVGADPALGLVELPQGREERVISRAIVLALQDLELGIPNLDPDVLLLPKTPWQTSIARISDATIRKYNAAVDDVRRLDPRNYSRRYEGYYVLMGNRLEIVLRVHLLSAGALGQPRPHDRDYSGRFFIDEIVGLITQKLKERSAAPSP